MRAIHTEWHAIHEVIIPPAEHDADLNKAVWLAALWHGKDREVHKDEISTIVRRAVEGAGADRQVRHLKRDGCDTGPSAGRHKLNPYEALQEFQNMNARRRLRLAATDFGFIKQSFGHRCATCGARERQPDPRYGTMKVQLQHGHRDPNEAGDDMANIIQQCRFCKRTYGNDLAFETRAAFMLLPS